jgi:hypothetical protein
MSPQLPRSTMTASAAVAIAFVLAAGPWQPAAAQQPGGRGGGRAAGPPAPLPTPQAEAPLDLAGVWVSVITESWRWRVVTPAKGDFASIPITPKAFKEASEWDPARDEAAREQCRAYGAAGLMRMPGRLRISWQDDRTLKVEMDAGTQTRLLHFGNAPAAAERTWQGRSTAEWVSPPPAGRGQGAGPEGPRTGYLKVTTTDMRPGYLRKNGVPYSGNAALTEYWNVHREPNGDEWLVVTSRLEDPEYLQEPFLTSPNFKKEPNDAKWRPTACEAR